MVMAGTQKPMQTPEAQELLKDSARLREMLSSPEGAIGFGGAAQRPQRRRPAAGGPERQGRDTAQLEQLMQGAVLHGRRAPG